MQIAYQNLVQPLVERAEAEPHFPSLVFVDTAGTGHTITAAELHDNAARWAALLQAHGVQPGRVVMINLSHSLPLFYSFLGAMYLGAIPTIYPSLLPNMSAAAYLAQLRGLAERADIATIVTTPDMAEMLPAGLGGLACDIIPVQDGGLDGLAPLLPDWPAIRPEQTAFLQFSSGTTGLKKGVIITHGAVLRQTEAMTGRAGLTRGDVLVSWLPTHHDMGLVANVLVCFTAGIQLVKLSSIYWIRNPKSLLQAVSQYGGTHTYMPNFAFNHCVRGIREEDIRGVDLSSWRFILNAAEPIRLDSITRFTEKFSPYGLPANAIHSAYGMAENTVAISFKNHADPLYVDWVDQERLQTTHQAVPSAPGAPGSLPIIGCGEAISGTELAIIDDAGQWLPDRHVGEIVLRGSSLFGGYFRQPELTAQAFLGDWFKTGDLGYLADGQVFVTGRKKDLIIVGGKNIHPEDLEEIANEVPGVYEGRVVAFGLFSERLGTEQIVIVVETRRPVPEEDALAMATEIRRRVAHQTDVVVHDVRVLGRRWVQKSSSGKVARSANRAQYVQEFLV